MRGRMCALACGNGRARGYRRSEADVQVRLSASARQALRCFSSREHTRVNWRMVDNTRSDCIVAPTAALLMRPIAGSDRPLGAHYINAHQCRARYQNRRAARSRAC